MVHAYAAEHPSKGYTAIASDLSLPKGRVRSWLDYETTPDVVAGIERARELARELRAEGFDVPGVAVDHRDGDGVEFFVGTCRTTTIQRGPADD